MVVKFNLDNEKVRVALLEGDSQLAEDYLPVDRKLSLDLLPFLDSFFKKNDVSPEKVEEFLLESDMKDSQTTYRIVKVAVDTLNLAKWL